MYFWPEGGRIRQVSLYMYIAVVSDLQARARVNHLMECKQGYSHRVGRAITVKNCVQCGWCYFLSVTLMTISTEIQGYR